MFQLSVVDHIRLSFGDVVCSYKAHATAAARLARRAWQIKMTVLSLLGLAVVAGVTSVVTVLRPFQIVSAVLISLAFVGYAAYMAFDFDPRVSAHRSCAARFWLLCEKYRALLTEIQDGLLDVPQLKERRDQLIREVHGVYEQAPAADQKAYGLARRALSSTNAEGVSDAEIDRYLPPSAQKGKPTAA
jgi:hypothetical protein